MSDNWIALVPEDPSHVPDRKRQDEAVQYFGSIAPDADKIDSKVSDRLMFFDCEANLQRIVCPHCEGDVPVA